MRQGQYAEAYLSRVEPVASDFTASLLFAAVTGQVPSDPQSMFTTMFSVGFHIGMALSKGYPQAAADLMALLNEDMPHEIRTEIEAACQQLARQP